MKNKTKITLRPLTKSEKEKFDKVDSGIVITISELTRRFPNDMDLGREVRRFFRG